MRITKKYTGNSSIGKRTFTPLVKSPENISFIEMSRKDLENLRANWINKLLIAEQVNQRKIGNLKPAGGRMYIGTEGFTINELAALRQFSSIIGIHDGSTSETVPLHDEKILVALQPFCQNNEELNFLLNWLKTSYYAVHHDIPLNELERLIQFGEMSLPAYHQTLERRNALFAASAAASLTHNSLHSSQAGTPQQPSPAANLHRAHPQLEDLQKVIEAYFDHRNLPSDVANRIYQTPYQQHQNPHHSNTNPNPSTITNMKQPPTSSNAPALHTSEEDEGNDDDDDDDEILDEKATTSHPSSITSSLTSNTTSSPPAENTPNDNLKQPGNPMNHNQHSYGDDSNYSISDQDLYIKQAGKDRTYSLESNESHHHHHNNNNNNNNNNSNQRNLSTSQSKVGEDAMRRLNAYRFMMHQQQQQQQQLQQQQQQAHASTSLKSQSNPQFIFDYSAQYAYFLNAYRAGKINSADFLQYLSTLPNSDHYISKLAGGSSLEINTNLPTSSSQQTKSPKISTSSETNNLQSKSDQRGSSQHNSQKHQYSQQQQQHQQQQYQLPQSHRYHPSHIQNEYLMMPETSSSSNRKQSCNDQIIHQTMSISSLQSSNRPIKRKLDDAMNPNQSTNNDHCMIDDDDDNDEETTKRSKSNHSLSNNSKEENLTESQSNAIESAAQALLGLFKR
jgi:hypothetical protein